MNVQNLKTSDLVPYLRNQKKHDKKQIDNVAESIKQFGMVQPIVVDKDNNVIIGHCRLLACQKLKIEEVPVVKLEELTPEQANELRLLDNKLNESDWDFDILTEDIPELDFTGFDIDWELPEDKKEPDNVEHSTLTDKFIVPPFSILDTRQGYWQDRKNAWKDLGLKSELGRKDNLINAPDLPEYANNKGLKGVAVQTSIFDPVLAEISYKWFNISGGKIFDCFAGGSVRGIVAEKLGYKYTGIDLRQEQIDANYENAKEIGVSPKWICDDSLNADKYLEDNSVDMIFSCPPYADLEVYSDDPRDISNMDYENFCRVYKSIIEIACRKLKQNRFAVFVVGDVRDKKGAYRNFVDYTKKCFNDNGLNTYNEFILIEQIGTGALRAKHQFEGMRKAIKTHQNVLVFYKGDIKSIKDEFGILNIEDDVFSQDNQDDE